MSLNEVVCVAVRNSGRICSDDWMFGTALTNEESCILYAICNPCNGKAPETKSGFGYAT